MKNVLICVDFQNDFLEGGNFEVKGGLKDVQNTINFINNHKIDKIICSLDMHVKNQIFFSSYWIDKNGKHPDPFTIISNHDIKDEKWLPVNKNKAYALEYTNKIEENGQRQLCIWPYHCLIGSKGAALENNLFNCIFENFDYDMIEKGQDLDSEMYGFIKPEYSRKDLTNYKVLEKLKEYDNVFVAGEAASHCVLDSVKQIAEYYKDNQDFLKKITILKDCTSVISGYEEITNTEFEKLKLLGIKIIESTKIL